VAGCLEDMEMSQNVIAVKELTRTQIISENRGKVLPREYCLLIDCVWGNTVIY